RARLLWTVPVIQALTVQLEREAGRAGIERCGREREARLRHLRAGLEIQLADALRLLELAQHRRGAAHGRRAGTPAPARPRGVHQCGQVRAEEAVERTAVAEYAPEVLQ